MPGEVGWELRTLYPPALDTCTPTLTQPPSRPKGTRLSHQHKGSQRKAGPRGNSSVAWSPTAPRARD